MTVISVVFGDILKKYRKVKNSEMPLISLRCASDYFFSLFVMIYYIVKLNVFSHSIKDGTVIVVT